MTSFQVKTKRVYEPFAGDDGRRVLVDRLWPRGLKKEALVLDEWMRDVAPSPELRKWFGHEPDRFAQFRRYYEEELTNDDTHRHSLAQLCSWAVEDNLTLLYAAKDPVCNHAVVLRDMIFKKLGEGQ
jgi:uncharacterized protein YeaO (DUF488 family)